MSKRSINPKKLENMKPISGSADRSARKKPANNFLLLSVVIILITIIVYGQVRTHGFIVWDDPLYVTRNLNVQSGFDWKSIYWAFTTNYAANWHPLTWLAHMLDYRFFGLTPGGHHLVNLFWHLLNSLFLFLILQSMTREIWPSFFVAILFGIHPLHVESVAWVAERKDVLSTFFWLLTTWLYLRYVQAPGLKNHVFVSVSLGLGLMVKPMLVTLPFTLILIDVWPLRRLQADGSWIPMLKEKIPFFILVLISIVLTLWAQDTGKALISLDLKPMSIRIENAITAYFIYLYRFFWPVGLSVFYPYPDSFSFLQLGFASVILVVFSWFAWHFRNRFPYVLTGWLWFLGTLVPVIGIVQVGGQALADRYTYIPSIGFFIVLAWGVKDFLSFHASFRGGVIFLCATAIIALSVLCFIQVRQWKDGISLFQHALSVREDNSLIHGCLGSTYIQQRNLELAERHLTRALEINPRYPEALNDLGTVLTETGRYHDAVAHFSKAVKLKPNFHEAHNNLGLTLTHLNRFSEAIAQYKIAISLNQMFPKALNNLGTALAQIGRFEEAEFYLSRAIEIQPNFIEAYNNLGLLHYQQRDYANSRAYFNAALSFDSTNPQVYFFLGLIEIALGRDREAVVCFNQALKLNPNFREAEAELNDIQKKQK